MCNVFIEFRLDSLNNSPAEVSQEIRPITMWGEDAWVGRQVRKKFWIGKGKKRKQVPYLGKITDVDEDADNADNRVFCVRYDDGDIEWLGVKEILSILLPLDNSESTPVVNDFRQFIILKLIMHLCVLSGARHVNDNRM